jgi:hypothetical protein
MMQNSKFYDTNIPWIKLCHEAQLVLSIFLFFCPFWQGEVNNFSSTSSSEEETSVGNASIYQPKDVSISSLKPQQSTLINDTI